MSDYVTQPEWARRCGVSLRTFYTWRAAGLIPAPDVNLPGQIRWTAVLVERTMRGFRRPKLGRPVGAFQRKQRPFKALATRPQRRECALVSSNHEVQDRSLDSQGVSGEAVGQRHAEQSVTTNGARPCNPVAESAR